MTATINTLTDRFRLYATDGSFKAATPQEVALTIALLSGSVPQVYLQAASDESEIINPPEGAVWAQQTGNSNQLRPTLIRRNGAWVPSEEWGVDAFDTRLTQVENDLDNKATLTVVRALLDNIEVEDPAALVSRITPELQPLMEELVILARDSAVTKSSILQALFSEGVTDVRARHLGESNTVKATLGEIRAEIADAKKTNAFASVALALAAMASDDGLVDGELYEIDSYHADINLGGGRFRYRATSEAAIDGGFVLGNAGSAGRLIRTDRSVIHADIFGCIPDGTTDNTAALDRMKAARVGTAEGMQFALADARPIKFGGGRYKVASFYEWETNGTGEHISGNGQMITNLDGIGLLITDRSAVVESLSLVGAGDYGLKPAGKLNRDGSGNPVIDVTDGPYKTNRRQGTFSRLHIRDRTIGWYSAAGGDDNVNMLILEKCLVCNFYYEHKWAGAGQRDTEWTNVRSFSAGVYAWYGMHGEHKMVNCVVGSSAVGLVIRDRAQGTASSVECYTGEFTGTKQAFGTLESITSITDQGDSIIRVMCANNYMFDEAVTISETTDYDGHYRILDATETWFEVTATFTSSQTGTARRRYLMRRKIISTSQVSAGVLELTFDSDCYISRGLKDLVITGTADIDGTYHCLERTGPKTITISATAATSQTGIIDTNGFDLVFEEGRNGSFSTNDFNLKGNFNRVMFGGNVYNYQSSNTRLKELIYMEGINRNLKLGDHAARGRDGLSDTAFIYPTGPGSNQGWTMIGSEDDDVLNDNNAAAVMITPSGSALGVSYEPELNKFSLSPQGLSLSIGGSVIFQADSDGFEVVKPKGRLRSGLGPDLTIAGDGSITVTHQHHKLFGNGSSADTLVTINGMNEGDTLILQAANSNQDITLADNVVARLEGTDNIVLAHARDTAFLVKHTASEISEVSRAINEPA